MHDEEEVAIPEDLARALQNRPEAEGIWDRLPARRGHEIAIERLVDANERAERVEHTIDHLFKKHVLRKVPNGVGAASSCGERTPRGRRNEGRLRDLDAEASPRSGQVTVIVPTIPPS